MEITVTTPFMAFGRRLEAGEVIDLPVAEAAYVVGLGRAAYVADADADEAPQGARRRKAKARVEAE
ncbi:MAG: hypothetical protein KA440_08590 [Azonexus sp.]|nr:hypothetical protein [Azonexus sp.]